MYKIDPKRSDLVKAFIRQPFGHHSGDLQQALNVLRGGPVKDRYVLIQTKPHCEWVLGQLTGERGKPVRVFPDKVYTSAEEAERAVFKLRWEEHTGCEIEWADS